MKTPHIIVGLALTTAALIVAGVLFVGLEYSVGDHESGNGHHAFLKASPTLTMTFFDPFQGGDAGGNPSRLPPHQRAQFADYCRYKMGVDGDEQTCFAAYQAIACNVDYDSRGIDCPADSRFDRRKKQENSHATQ